MNLHAWAGAIRISVAVLAAVAISPTAAFAYRVYSPIVTPDETAVGFWSEMGTNGESSTKPGSRRMLLDARHTFLDRLDLGIAAVGESGVNMSSSEGEGIGFSRMKFRGVWQITEKSSHFVDFGLYADYQNMQGTVRDTLSDYLNINLLFEKDFGSWFVTFDPGIRKSLTTVSNTVDNVGTYQAAFKYRFHPLFNPGVEFYGINLGRWDHMDRFDQQRHNAGPAVYGDTAPINGYVIRYEGAILAGLTSASEIIIVNLIFEVRF